MTRFADQGCATLAYGDAKRVELALALANAPRLLLMDEPTAGMSPQLAQPADAARRGPRAPERRIAVLFTEHDMDVVFGHADRVIVLDRGRIIAEGSPDGDPRRCRGCGGLPRRGRAQLNGAAIVSAGEPGETVGEIGDEVVRILEADVQAQAGPARRPSASRCARVSGADRDDQALEAAPAPAHAEQRACRRASRRCAPSPPAAARRRRARRAGEVALPQLVAARARAAPGRCTSLHLGPRRAASCATSQRARLVPREPRRQRAQAAQARGSSRRCDAVTPMSVHSRCSAGASRSLVEDQPQQHVGVPADVLGRRVHRDVDAMVERRGSRTASPSVLSITTRAPCACATSAIAGMSCTSKVSEPGDSVNTMRVLGRNSRSMPAPTQRIVVAHVDAEARQVQVAEAARRPVDRVGDQHVVARLRQRQQRQRRRGRARTARRTPRARLRSSPPPTAGR